MENTVLLKASIISLITSVNVSAEHHESMKNAMDETSMQQQRQMLQKNTQGKGYGPQSPRDIDVTTGNNAMQFTLAPDSSEMNLCNIHFHAGAEHKGGEFTRFLGPGDGKGYQTGYAYSGSLSSAELTEYTGEVCPAAGTSLQAGDTIEVHYVYSSAKIKPGATLGACLSDAVMNPQLRVEAQVYVLVNDDSASDFIELTRFEQIDDRYQAVNIPTDTGVPVRYAGSTTGPKYNEEASPLNVTWSVRPKVEKVNIATVDKWCKDNAFDEHKLHGVRNLVVNPDLLSEIH